MYYNKKILALASTDLIYLSSMKFTEVRKGDSSTADYPVGLVDFLVSGIYDTLMDTVSTN
jgi:hypothetical protein